MLQLKLVSETHCYVPHNFLVQNKVTQIYNLSPRKSASVEIEKMLLTDLEHAGFIEYIIK